MFYRFFTFALLTAVIIFSPLLAGAQASNPGSFSLFPAKKELLMSPGQSETVVFTVVNNLGFDQEFEISVDDFSPSTQDNSGVDIGTGPVSNSLRDYVTIPERVVAIPAGGEARLSILINLPTNATPGSRHGAVLVSAETQSTGQTKLVSRLGSLLFVKVTGEVVEEGELIGFDLIGSNVKTQPPLMFEIQFENDGNSYLNPYGIIEIKNLFGGTKLILPVDPWFVLPDSERFREIAVKDGWWWGFYRAELSLNRGYGDVIDFASTWFVVTPIWLIIFLSIALISLGLVVLRFRLRKMI